MYNAVPSYAKLAERGYVTAIIQHRESEIAKFPAQVEDIVNAVDFLRKKQNEQPWRNFRMDMSRLFLMGNSSGGHIALMTALMSANNMTESLNISGVIAESAPTDMFMCGKNHSGTHTKALLGVDDIPDGLDSAKRAGCDMYIAPNIPLPPMLLMHGTADSEVDIEHSRRLYKKLTDAGKNVQLYEIEGAGHGGSVFWSSEILDIIEKFIGSCQ